MRRLLRLGSRSFVITGQDPNISITKSYFMISCERKIRSTNTFFELENSNCFRIIERAGCIKETLWSLAFQLIENCGSLTIMFVLNYSIVFGAFGLCLCAIFPNTSAGKVYNVCVQRQKNVHLITCVVVMIRNLESRLFASYEMMIISYTKVLIVIEFSKVCDRT